MWSKGYALHCDVHGPEDYFLRGTEDVQPASFFDEHYSNAKGLVWIRLGSGAPRGEASDLDHFVEGALSSIEEPFILVTSDGDASVPTEFSPATVGRLLASDHLKGWLTQNLDSHLDPRLTPIPIGLDLHRTDVRMSPHRRVERLREIADRAVAVDHRSRRVFCDLGLNVTSDQRRAIAGLAADCSHITVPRSRVSQTRIWRRYADHRFVLSAQGNGPDCHRTWEALYLGCIVITRRSALDPLYQGLPVVLVTDWDEVREKANLERWAEQMAPLTDLDRIWDRLEPTRWLQAGREALEA
jgi:hypothetical protein